MHPTPPHPDRANGPAAGLAMLWVALLAGVLMDAVVKLLGQEVAVGVTVAWRWGFAALLLLPLALRRFTRGDWVPWQRVHLVRTALNLVCTYALVLGLQRLPLALVMTILFAEPLLMLLLAAALAGQRLPRLQGLVCLLGLLGVGLATYGDWRGTQSDPQALLLAAGLSLLGALAGALQTVLTQRDAAEVPTLSLVFWTSALTSALALPLAGPAAWALDLRQAALLLLVAALGTGFALLWVEALKRVPARRAAHVLYMSLPLGALVGWYGFDETPHAVSVFGSLCVFTAVLALEWLDQRRGPPQPAPAAPPLGSQAGA